MYQAIVRGHVKRVFADSLKQLAQKLSRENIRLSESELSKYQEQLDAGFPVEVIATRKLTRNELIKKSMRPPYLGNSFRRIEDTEQVSLRVTSITNHKKKG